MTDWRAMQERDFDCCAQPQPLALFPEPDPTGTTPIDVDGLADNGPEPAHADYPHDPGTLYDCPACEARCYCHELAQALALDLADGTQCVACAIAAETTRA